MKNLNLLWACLFLMACHQQHPTASLERTLGNEAQWIQDSRALPQADSLFYLDHPAPLFRKSFSPNGLIEEAYLLITAAGYYKASLNGVGIENNVLDPAWTDFSKRIYYSEYEVTALLRKGENCLGVALAMAFTIPYCYENGEVEISGKT